MRWKGREQSENVEDRRGMGPAAVGGIGGVGLLIVLAIAFLTNNPQLLQQVAVQQQQQAPAGPQSGAAADPEAKEFIAVVLRDTEQVWTELFRKHVQGGTYVAPKLVMFSGVVNTGCGTAPSNVGPFYCPADQKVYIDPSFFAELSKRHHAPGDFANAFVIAHEVAHHVQGLTGFAAEVDKVRARGNQVETNRASVRLELQADYLAGVWAHHAQQKYQILEQGDIEEAINAANRIGDDVLMKEATGRVKPDLFTHGTAEQRSRWFREGLRTGDFEGCRQLFTLDYSEL